MIDAFNCIHIHIHIRICICTTSGDYFIALHTLEHVELNKKSLYSRVPKCQITVYYYVAFCYLMMRRYPCSSSRPFIWLLITSDTVNPDVIMSSS